jgi:macrolide transport system ATP-binding/permease protein
MLRDLKFAVRFFRQHKAFTAAAVLTLAIGLGANTALYGLLDATMRPMALPEADRIVTIAANVKGDETGGFQYSFSTEQLKDLQERASCCSAIVGFWAQVGGMAWNGKASPFWYAAVSDNYFSGLGVVPAAGTLFTKSSGSPVHVVLGHSFWVRSFGADPGVIGKTVLVEGLPAVITGVVQESFRGSLLGLEMDGYLAIDDMGALVPDTKRWLYHNRKARPMQLFGRLKPGVSVSDAQASMDVLMAALEAEHPESDRGVGAVVMPEPLGRPMPMRAVREAIPFVQLLGLVLGVLVLLLACMNVANLLLVRATARRRELAVRAALGASRWRLVRQMVTEGSLLSAIGGAAGLVAGQLVTRTYLARLDLAADVPLHFDTSLNLSVFAFSLGAAILTGIVIGVWPAWRASRADARAALHDGGKSSSDGADRQRVRRLLVVGQIAGALALLIVAGLFVRTLRSAQRIDLGFDAAKLISVRLDPRQLGYDEDRTVEFYRTLQRRVAAWPNVEFASYCLGMPMSLLIGGGSVFIEGRTQDADTQPPATFVNHIAHDYFSAMGIPIVRGRAFTADDENERSGTRRYAIVNEAFAEKYWPGQDPIGKRLQVFSNTDPMLEVVGVARDSKYVVVFESKRPYLYLPVVRDLSLRTLVVRATGDPTLLAPQLEREIQSIAPDMPMADLRPMSEALGGLFGYLIFKIGAIQAAGMGLLGLILAIVGVYGVVSFGAGLRTREIGIRVALGAHPRDVLRLILGQGLGLVGVGILVGLVLSVLLGRLLSKFLPLVDATDWATFGIVAIGMAVLALLACYLPARRATKVPVTTALRHE